MMFFTVSVKNVSIKILSKNRHIYAFLFLLIIVPGTCELVWNNLLSKQSSSIKLPNEHEKRTIR